MRRYPMECSGSCLCRPVQCSQSTCPRTESRAATRGERFDVQGGTESESDVSNRKAIFFLKGKKPSLKKISTSCLGVNFYKETRFQRAGIILVTVFQNCLIFFLLVEKNMETRQKVLRFFWNLFHTWYM